MARVPLTRNSVGQFVRTAQIAAGSNVTITETVSGSVLTVTVSASGGGGGGTPASSVVSETSYGQAPVVGTSTDYARGDHSHGTPAVPAHSSTTGLGWSSSGHTGAANAVATWDSPRLRTKPCSRGEAASCNGSQSRSLPWRSQPKLPKSWSR